MEVTSHLTVCFQGPISKRNAKREALVNRRSMKRSPIWNTLRSRRSARSTQRRSPFLMTLVPTSMSQVYSSTTAS